MSQPRIGPIANRVLLRDDTPSPLGRLTMAGTLVHERGVGRLQRRVLGSYAIVYLLEGSGLYADANHRRQRVVPGDLLVLFPEIAHSYGPGLEERWAEIYVVFDGPVFECCRASGLLDPARPVHHIEPLEPWYGAMEAVFEPARPATPAWRTVQTCRFLEVLAGLLTAGPQTAAAEPSWVVQARTLLEGNLESSIRGTDVAQAVGMSEQSFRKQFQAATGQAPAHYRLQKRLDAAAGLLRHSQLSNKEIAASLGFADAFHFSRLFSKHRKMSPRAFRAMAAQGVD